MMAMSAETGQRRVELIEATLECIAEHGLENATVRKIAEIARVTNGLIRFYFKNKEGLIRESYAHFLDTILLAAVQRIDDPSVPPLLRLRQFVEANLSPPIVSARTVVIWGSFLRLAQADPELDAIRARFSAVTIATFRELVHDVSHTIGQPLSEAEAAEKAVILNCLIDGLWLEGSSPASRFDGEELKRVGTEAVAQLLGIREFPSVTTPA